MNYRFAVSLLLSIVLLQQASAQESNSDANRLSIGVLGGAWSIGHGQWPFFLMNVEFDLTPQFAIGATAGAVSRPRVLCSDGIDDPMCDRWKLIRMLTATARLDLTRSRMRPYIGISTGRTWYFGVGSIGSLHGGLSLTASRNVTVRLDGALHFLAEEDIGGATSIQAGVFIRP